MTLHLKTSPHKIEFSAEFTTKLAEVLNSINMLRRNRREPNKENFLLFVHQFAVSMSKLTSDALENVEYGPTIWRHVIHFQNADYTEEVWIMIPDSTTEHPITFMSETKSEWVDLIAQSFCLGLKFWTLQNRDNSN